MGGLELHLFDGIVGGVRYKSVLYLNGDDIWGVVCEKDASFEDTFCAGMDWFCHTNFRRRMSKADGL